MAHTRAGEPRPTLAERARRPINTNYGPDELNSCGLIWEAALDQEGGSVITQCLFFRPSDPHTNDFDQLYLPQHGKGWIYFGDGSYEPFYRTPTSESGSIFVKAGTPHWVIPDHTPGWPVHCRLVTWPRFVRGGGNPSTSVNHRHSTGPEDRRITDEWWASLRSRLDDAMSPSVDVGDLQITEHGRGMSAADLLRALTQPGMEALPTDIQEIRDRWFEFVIGKNPDDIDNLRE